MVPKMWREFDGKRYTLVTVTSKKTAEARARQLRKYGGLTRIVTVARASEGEGGYTVTRYAVYARYAGK